MVTYHIYGRGVGIGGAGIATLDEAMEQLRLERKTVSLEFDRVREDGTNRYVGDATGRRIDRIDNREDADFFARVNREDPDVFWRMSRLLSALDDAVAREAQSAPAAGRFELAYRGKRLGEVEGRDATELARALASSRVWDKRDLSGAFDPREGVYRHTFTARAL